MAKANTVVNPGSALALHKPSDWTASWRWRWSEGHAWTVPQGERLTFALPLRSATAPSLPSPGLGYIPLLPDGRHKGGTAVQNLDKTGITVMRRGSSQDWCVTVDRVLAAPLCGLYTFVLYVSVGGETQTYFTEPVRVIAPPSGGDWSELRWRDEGEVGGLMYGPGQWQRWYGEVFRDMNTVDREEEVMTGRLGDEILVSARTTLRERATLRDVAQYSVLGLAAMPDHREIQLERLNGPTPAEDLSDGLLTVAFTAQRNLYQAANLTWTSAWRFVGSCHEDVQQVV